MVSEVKGMFKQGRFKQESTSKADSNKAVLARQPHKKKKKWKTHKWWYKLLSMHIHILCVDNN